MQERHVEIECIEEKKIIGWVEGKKTWKEHCLCCVLTVANNEGSGHLDNEAPTRFQIGDWFPDIHITA